MQHTQSDKNFLSYKRIYKIVYRRHLALKNYKLMDTDTLILVSS